MKKLLLVEGSEVSFIPSAPPAKLDAKLLLKVQFEIMGEALLRLMAPPGLLALVMFALNMHREIIGEDLET